MEEQKEKIYSSYTEAQKRATKKYRENNKDKVNEQRKKYYQNRKAKDPNFLIYKRQKAKEYYNKKKVNKVKEHEIIKEVKEEFIKSEPVELIIEKVVEHPVLDEKKEEKEEKKKRKYTKKNKTI
jgi:hypothetical protein